MPSDYTPQQPKLLDQVRTAIRLRRMSYRTEQTYTDWIKRFIIFHHKRHPREWSCKWYYQFVLSTCRSSGAGKSGNLWYWGGKIRQLPGAVGLMDVFSACRC
jgi:hypothetical protein